MKLCKSRPIYWYTNIVYSEGYSVLWCLSNREDQILLTLLWTPWRKTPEQYLQSSLYLMSLMGSIKHGYQHSIDIHKKTTFVACRLCLERCLEKQKCQIYYVLHTLVNKDDNNFEHFFNEFKTCTDNNESTKCFAKYFKLEYSQHKHQCATCYG